MRGSQPFSTLLNSEEIGYYSHLADDNELVNGRQRQVGDSQTKKGKMARKTLKSTTKYNTLVSKEPNWYAARDCYQVIVPARLSENGRRRRRFFATKAAAEKFILETKRRGLVELTELAAEEKHVLGVIRQSERYEPGLLL